MKPFVRLFISVAVALATFYFMLLVPFSLILPGVGLQAIRVLGSLAGAILLAAYIWRLTDSMSAGLVACVGFGAVVTGGVGFLGGFLGPMIFDPSANQGPMLGIFITGPLGFLLGAVGGAIYWAVRRQPATID